MLVTFMWRHYRSEFSWWRHGVLPVAGAITFTLALWKSVDPLPAEPLNYFPLAIIIWVLIGLALMTWIQRRNPRQLDTIGKTMFIEVDEEAETPASA